MQGKTLCQNWVLRDSGGAFKSQVLYSDQAILRMVRVISAYAILRLNDSINIFS